MNLILRLMRVLLAAVVRRHDLGPLDASELAFRVWPNDLDLNGHMNNGCYLTLMDLGRIDLVMRMGLGHAVWRQRWRPMVASATIQFRRSLRPFQRYQLISRLVGWDDRWFFVEQRVQRAGEVMAIGLIKGMFRGHMQRVPPAEVLRSIAVTMPSPAMPPAIQAWQHAEALVAGANDAKTMPQFTTVTGAPGVNTQAR